MYPESIPLKARLEVMSDRIETVLALNKIPARVTGGTVTPRWVSFQVLPAVGAETSRIKSLTEELAAALDVPACRVLRRGAALAIEVPRDDPQPVRLLPLYRQLRGEIPPATAILGLAEDGAPLLIRLPSPDVAHILVCGTTGSGKTVLLQTMILSLALSNPPPTREGGLALVLIDPKRRAFGHFEGLPHLARNVIWQEEEAVEALHSLVRLMEVRSREGYKDTRIQGASRQGSSPCIPVSLSTCILVIDELADLLMSAGKRVQEPLTRLTQRGREAGIHVIAATQKPAVLGLLVKANFPVRLVGKVTSVEDARTASGIGGSGAERLAGRGDFLAIAEGRVIRFQAAYITPEETEEEVEEISTSTPPEEPFFTVKQPVGTF